MYRKHGRTQSLKGNTDEIDDYNKMYPCYSGYHILDRNTQIYKLG
jgi:hypothetical protein